MPPDPKHFHELFKSITNNYRFIPFDQEPAAAAVLVPGAAKEPEDNRPPLTHAGPMVETYSGRITLNWVARTPVLFGAGKDNDGVVRPQRLHSGVDAPYVFSGSAQRGMIRRLLRIATKGKIGAYYPAQPFRRDPSYQKARINGTQASKLDAPECGWLIFGPIGNDGTSSWSLKPCRRIPYQCDVLADKPLDVRRSNECYG